MDFLPCTYLFVPGDRPERFVKALGSGADRIIIDLEDAVKPEAKADARDAICSAKLDWSRVVIRINDVSSRDHELDLAAVASTNAAAVMVPKTETPETLRAMHAAVGHDIEIIPQIETAVGLKSMGSILGAAGVRRCAFGHLDFALDLGCEPDWEALLMVRSEIVLQSRLANAVAPIESVTTDLADETVIAHDAARAKRLGFGAKLLIHPKQVAPVQQAFAPSADEVAWAERVLEAEASAGAVRVDGRMVDKPVVEAARAILRRKNPGE